MDGSNACPKESHHLLLFQRTSQLPSFPISVTTNCHPLVPQPQPGYLLGMALSLLLSSTLSSTLLERRELENNAFTHLPVMLPRGWMFTSD